MLSIGAQSAQAHPFVEIVRPAAGERFEHGRAITVEVEAISGHDVIVVEEVSLILDGDEIATLTAAPYLFEITPELGRRKLRATAKDSEHQRGESDDLFVEIVPSMTTGEAESTATVTGGSESTGGASGETDTSSGATSEGSSISTGSDAVLTTDAGESVATPVDSDRSVDGCRSWGRDASAQAWASIAALVGARARTARP